MKEVTKKLIKNFKIYELGYDFMGYTLQKGDCYNYHHLIINRNYCKHEQIGQGYSYDNGIILCGNSSHRYLHLIENIEEDLFDRITSELFDMKVKGYLDKENMIKIHQMLEYFECKHLNDKNTRGQYLIKEEYLNRKKFS